MNVVADFGTALRLLLLVSCRSFLVFVTRGTIVFFDESIELLGEFVRIGPFDATSHGLFLRGCRLISFLLANVNIDVDVEIGLLILLFGTAIIVASLTLVLVKTVSRQIKLRVVLTLLQLFPLAIQLFP